MLRALNGLGSVSAICNSLRKSAKDYEGINLICVFYILLQLQHLPPYCDPRLSIYQDSTRQVL